MIKIIQNMKIIRFGYIGMWHFHIIILRMEGYFTYQDQKANETTSRKIIIQAQTSKLIMCKSLRKPISFHITLEFSSLRFHLVNDNIIIQ